MNRVDLKIPGKIMLAGEYSVLFGGSALAVTVKNHMEITATINAAGWCNLSSDLWESPISCPRSELDSAPSDIYISAVSTALEKYDLPGISVKIKGNLKPEYGFGSSSALRLGIMVALKTLKTGTISETYWEEAIEAFRLQKQNQKRASGYDIVTQHLGGLVRLTPSVDVDQWPGKITVFNKQALRKLNTHVHVFVGGRGAPTAPLMGSTLAWIERNTLEQEIVSRSEQLIGTLLAFIGGSVEIGTLIEATTPVRQLFESAPEFPIELLTKLKRLSGFDRNFTLKTTGAGGEDAILLIGDEANIAEGVATLMAEGWRQIKKPFVQNDFSIRCEDLSTADELMARHQQVEEELQ